MRPLHEETGSSDPAQARAAALLRAGRLPPPSESTADRVRRGLRTAHSPARRRSGLVRRVAAVIILLFGSAFTAFAAPWIRQALLHRSHVEPARAAAISPPQRPPSPAKSAAASATSDESIAPAAPGLPAAPGANVQRPIDGARGVEISAELDRQPAAPPARRPPAARRGHLQPRPTAGSIAEETALLYEAMRRLRVDKDPAGAAERLREYERRFPGGALAEDACYFAIELAGDEAQKAAAARQYLSRFPEGVYRDEVSRPLKSP